MELRESRFFQPVLFTDPLLMPKTEPCTHLLNDLKVLIMAADMYLALTLPQRCPKHMNLFPCLRHNSTAKHRAGTEKVSNLPQGHTASR